jgi:hypothetical protein
LSIKITQICALHETRRRQDRHAGAHPANRRPAVLRPGHSRRGRRHDRGRGRDQQAKDDLIVAYLSRRLRPRDISEQPPAQQILDDFDRLERSFAAGGFRGCPFVNAVAELKEPGHAANELALVFKEQRRAWFRDLLIRLGVADPEGLAMQLMLLVDGAIAAALVRGDPAVARAARQAARVLLKAAGVATGGPEARPKAPRHAKK